MMGWHFNARSVLVATLAAVATEQVLGRFVLRSDMNPGGFVEVGGGPLGLGLDDVVRGVALLGTLMLADRIVPKF